MYHDEQPLAMRDAHGYLGHAFMEASRLTAVKPNGMPLRRGPLLAVAWSGCFG
jgi:hypothetical protein